MRLLLLFKAQPRLARLALEAEEEIGAKHKARYDQAGLQRRVKDPMRSRVFVPLKSWGSTAGASPGP
jgi:hypothetical protein